MLFVKVLYSSGFWLPTMVLYLNSRGISTPETLFLLGMYYIVAIALEYPTGVIGDLYSHRVAIASGYALLVAGFLLLAFPISTIGLTYFIAGFLFIALGDSLVSGSDTALLHDVSPDFSKDYPTVQVSSQSAMFVALSIGGLSATIDLRLPLLLSALAQAGACLFALSISFRRDSGEYSSNALGIALAGLSSVRKSRLLTSLLAISFVVGSFFYSLKWLYNDLFRLIGLPLGWWGIVPGIATLFAAFGAIVYRRWPKLPLTVAFLILVIAVPLIGFTSVPMLSVSAIFVGFLFRGYFDSRIMVSINHAVSSSVRASILSLGSFSQRLGASAYMFVGSLVIGSITLPTFLGFAGLFMAVAGLSPLLFVNRLQNRPDVTVENG